MARINFSTMVGRIANRFLDDLTSHCRHAPLARDPSGTIWVAQLNLVSADRSRHPLDRARQLFVTSTATGAIKANFRQMHILGADVQRGARLEIQGTPAGFRPIDQDPVTEASVEAQADVIIGGSILLGAPPARGRREILFKLAFDSSGVHLETERGDDLSGPLEFPTPLEAGLFLGRSTFLTLPGLYRRSRTR